MNFWTPSTKYPNQFILHTTVGGVNFESGVLTGDVLAQARDMAEKAKAFVTIHAIEDIYEDCGSEDVLFTNENRDLIEKYANSNMGTYPVAYVDARWSYTEVTSCFSDD
jgi:hypothetical protein